KLVRLEHNHRSAAPVLAVANSLMRGRPGALNLVSDRPAEDAPIPSVAAFSDDEDEARGVARAVAAQIAAGIDPRNIAILYRARSQSPELLRALADEQVATSVLGGTRFFDMPEVRQAVMALRAAAVAPLETTFREAVRDVLRSLGLTEEPPPAGGAVRDAWEARAAILRLADEAPPGATLRTFADELVT